MPDDAPKLPEEDRPELGADVLRNREQKGAGSGSSYGTGTAGGGNFTMGGRRPGQATGDPRATASPGKGANLSNRSGTTSAADSADLRQAEHGLDYLLGSGYIDDAPNRRSRIRRRFTQRRVMAGVALGVFGFGGGALLLFSLFLPLKMENIVQNAESHYFASSNDAVGTEVDNMFKGWVKKELAPAMAARNCAQSRHVIISKDCTIHVAGDGNNPVTNLYKTWSDAKLENQLADDHNIELRYDPGGRGTFYLKAPGISGENGVKIGDGVSGIDDSEFAAVDRGTVRQAFKDAEKDMTLWDKVLYRYKVGRLLEQKYGIKRCLFFCQKRDAFADNKADRKYAFKGVLVDRVISPRAATAGAVIGCLLDQNRCDSPSSTACTESNCDELGGESMDEAQADVEKATAAATKDIGSETGSKLVSKISDVREAGGPTKYVVKEALTQLFGSDTAEDAVPVVGWLQMLNQISNFIHTTSNAAQTIKKFSFLVNSGAAVQLFSMFQSYTDEVHTGNVNITEVGSFSDALGPGNHCDKTVDGSSCEQIGGTASAEQAPMYSKVVGGSHPQLASTGGSGTSLLADLLMPGAAADSGGSSDSTPAYLCNDKSPPSGSPTCPEEKLGQAPAVVQGASNALNSSGLGPLSDAYSSAKDAVTGLPIIGSIINVGNDVVGWVASGAAGAVEATFQTLLPSVYNSALSLASTFFNFLTNVIMSNPFGSVMSGGRTVDMLFAGADAANASYAQNGLGGQALTPQQAADIQNQQQAEDQASFQNQPLFARMFSTDSQYSLLSRFATEIPFGTQAEVQSGFASILNPLSSLSHGFASLFSSSDTTSADDSSVPGDDFGITQYGYTQQELAKIGDGSDYWDQHCSDNPDHGYQNDTDYNSTGGGKGWNGEAAATPDPNTGMPENTTTNPCMLIKASTGAGGGALDTSNLSQADLADENGYGGGSDSTGGSTGAPATGISGSGSGKFTTDTSHPAYPGVDQMLATVKKVNDDPSYEASFCASMPYGTCASACMAAVGMAWIEKASGYEDPFGSAGNTPAADSAWAAALATGHAHPNDRNPPVGALLIYNKHDPADKWGHVTIYLGNNLVFSTDFDHPSGAGIDPASHIEVGDWANSYVGWMDPLFYGKVGN